LTPKVLSAGTFELAGGRAETQFYEGVAVPRGFHLEYVAKRMAGVLPTWTDSGAEKE